MSFHIILPRISNRIYENEIKNLINPPVLSSINGTKAGRARSYEGITVTRNRRATSCKHRPVTRFTRANFTSRVYTGCTPGTSINERGMRDSTTTLGAQPEPESYFPRDPWCFAINTRISKCARLAGTTHDSGGEGGREEGARAAIDQPEVKQLRRRDSFRKQNGPRLCNTRRQ